MYHLPFQSLQNISIFFTMLHNIKCLVNIKNALKSMKIFFAELLLASDCHKQWRLSDKKVLKDDWSIIQCT